ncbi:hypothetical protein BDN72DRAFT_964833 [Pluteus cervinus]|uniref:Uncharacterized protein n=1 Tax=Pluteus cervinus TaxID=181527 RepID=A0ACD3A816_9AGAR|nr:hypothetical protein BDN72DRAFT_964833 [Pluteus cervinus]
MTTLIAPEPTNSIPPEVPKIPERWKMGTPLKNPLPKSTSQSCWEQCYVRVKEHDEDMCKLWKDEIDKLLIFAGLFSAAVTAFVVESYQWLEASSDDTAILLAQLLLIQSNGTITRAMPGPFTPTPSAVRINICWFLSLVLSLISVLIGVLCLQWLREYEKPVAMSFEDKLRYRQIRYEGLIAWKVPRIIASLPTLIQTALVLFFIGVIDLLWQRNHAVAIAVIVPIVCTISFLIAATILPVLQAVIIRLRFYPTIPFTQCPYKSRLSWTICQFTLPLLDKAWSRKDTISEWQLRRSSPFQALWPGFDHFWAIFTEGSTLSRSIQWMRSEFKYDSQVIPAIYECLNTVNPDTARCLAESIEEEFQQIFGAKSSFPEFFRDDFTKIREVACALQLRRSYTTDVHRLALRDSRLGLLLKNRSSSVSSLSTGERLSLRNNMDPDSFAEQTLMCTLSAIDSIHMNIDFPLGQILSLIQSVSLSTLHDGSVASHLLQTNLLRLRDYLRHHPPETVSEKARAVWGIIQMNKPSEVPEQIQPYLADLAWTAMRRVNGFVKGNSTWLEFFRVGSWDLARTLRERDRKLWWIKERSVLEVHKKPHTAR